MGIRNTHNIKLVSRAKTDVQLGSLAPRQLPATKISYILRNPKRTYSRDIIDALTADPKTITALENFIEVTKELGSQPGQKTIYLPTNNYYLYTTIFVWTKEKNGWFPPKKEREMEYSIGMNISAGPKGETRYTFKVTNFNHSNEEELECTIEYGGPAGICLSAQPPFDRGLALGIQFLQWLHDTDGTVVPEQS